MRIKKIEIKNLFGHLNHTIELKEKNITIIYGLNSSGKTTILKILEYIFRRYLGYPSYFKGYLSIPYLFDYLRISFDDSEFLELKRREDIEEVNDYSFYINHSIAGENLERLLKIPTEEMEESTIKGLLVLQKNLYNEAIEKINITFIETQRIQDSDEIHYINHLDEQDKEKVREEINLVRRYSNQLKSSIFDMKEKGKRKYNSYTRLEGYFDRQEEYLESIQYIKITPSELERKIENLKSRIDSLSKVGLLEENITDELHQQLNKKIKESYFGHFCFELTEIENTLDFYKPMVDKINLFTNVVGKKFIRKKMEITKDEGIVFSTSEHKLLVPTIPVEYLSSGEKQILVIFYRLIFDTAKNHLILIDEPELSLHVGWQEQFIDSLFEIQEENDIYFLIATHSPQIICNHWDLTVELEVPDE